MLGAGLAAIALAVLASQQMGPPRRGWVAGVLRRLDQAACRAVDGALLRLRGASGPDPVVELCTGLCAELRAGVPARTAMVEVAGSVGVAPRARSAALLGEPVAEALLHDAAAAASPGLAAVATCWRVAGHTGAGLVDGLERVAELARSRERLAGDLAAETAAPRATARVLTLLPLFGLGLGQLFGADPVRWLVGGPIGIACLAVGAAFLIVGRLWVLRIMRGALPSPSDGWT